MHTLANWNTLESPLISLVPLRFPLGEIVAAITAARERKESNRIYGVFRAVIPVNSENISASFGNHDHPPYIARGSSRRFMSISKKLHVDIEFSGVLP